MTLVTSEGREETNGLDEGEEEGGGRLSPHGKKGKEEGNEKYCVISITTRRL